MRETKDIPWGWKSMWIIAMFDLPTNTKEERKAASKFRHSLLKDGFKMMQYSVYFRHCSSVENSTVHINRMGSIVPDEGSVRFITITDNQFSRTISFTGKQRKTPEKPTPQLLLL